MTQQEWDAKWNEVFEASRAKDPSADLLKMHRAVTDYVVSNYGARPAGEPAPPWWMKLGAVAAGVPMSWLSGFWNFMNGKKTVVGLVITALAWLSTFVPALMAAMGTEPSKIAAVTGVLVTIVGIAHKIYKFIYKEEHP